MEEISNRELLNRINQLQNQVELLTRRVEQLEHRNENNINDVNNMNSVDNQNKNNMNKQIQKLMLKAKNMAVDGHIFFG